MMLGCSCPGPQETFSGPAAASGQSESKGLGEAGQRKVPTP